MALVFRSNLKRVCAVSVACGLVACGGGSSDSGNPPVTLPTVSALSQAESNWVRDDPVVYDVLTRAVLTGQVITRDATYTFADVNSDIDPNDTYVPEIAAHIVLDAPGGYPDDGLASNATLRLRGNSSREAAQKSYRIKLAKTAALWRGEQTLQFNKHPWDLSRVRNKLAMDLFRAIPHIPSLRTQFVQLGITNLDRAGVAYASADFGLFTHVEKMGKEYLAQRSLPTDGNLYKAEDFTFRMVDALKLDAAGAPVNKALFETVLSLEADNGNHARLIEMLAAVNDPAADFDSVFARYFDKPNYLTWLATTILMGNHDTLVQNFALNQPKGSDKFYFLPWDYDGAFGFEDQPDQSAAGRLHAPWQKSVGNWWDVPLHRRFIQDPKHLAELKQAVEEIYAAHLTEAKIKTLLDGYQPLVQPRVSSDPDASRLPTVTSGVSDRQAEWAAEYSRLPATVATHRQQFLAGLDAPMPFYTAVNLVGSNHLLTWDAAVDLQGDAVTYTVELATSPDFAAGTVLLQSTGLSATERPTPRLANGSYYLRVTARDATGHTQSSFDRAVVAKKTYFGVLALNVNGDVVTVP